MDTDHEEGIVTDATYVLGTDQIVTLELECTRPGFVFDPGNWTAQVTLVVVGEAFVDDETTPWVDALLETVDGHHYALAKLIELLDPVKVGKYRALVRATYKSAGYETPLLRAVGIVEVTP